MPADDPFTTLMRILGLPVEAAEVAEGWLPPADLPDARRIASQPLVRALWSSVTTVPTEPGRLNDLQRLWIERPTTYWVLTGAEIVLCAAGAAAALRRTGGPVPRGRRLLGRALVALALVNAADLAVPRRLRGLGR